MGHWEAIGKSDEWYTPKHVFDAMGVHFNQDVAGSLSLHQHVPCDYVIANESLSTFWRGFVWMNPPFGGRNALQPWLEKFFAHGHGVALTPDRSSAPWFRYAWERADLVLFTPKLKFVRADGSVGKSPSSGTALWAVGGTGMQALKNAAAAGLGVIGMPLKVAPNG